MGTVVEVNHGSCTIKTFAGRENYCGVDIVHNHGQSYWTMPYNGGECELPTNVCGEVQSGGVYAL